MAEVMESKKQHPSYEKELETHFQLYVLFYCWNKGDKTKYPLSLHGVCELKFSQDEYGETTIDNWCLSYIQPPTRAMLLTYCLTDVLTWYNNVYELPIMIQQHQPFIVVTNEQIHHIDKTQLKDNSIVLNSTRRELMLFNATNNKWQTL